MAALFLTPELAEQFTAALLEVIRADHAIEIEEARAVQAVVSRLLDRAVDYADAMLMTVTPESFATAVGAARTGPYRGVSVSSPSEIARSFERAANEIAAVNGPVEGSEAQVVQAYVDALDALR